MAVEFHRDGPWELPEGWVWTSLAAITSELVAGKRPKGGARANESGYLSVGGEHLKPDGSFDFSIPRFIPTKFSTGLERARLQIGDICIVKDGATTGKTCFFSFDRICFVNEHVFIVRLHQMIEPKFVYYWLWSLAGQKEIQKDHRGSAQGGIGRTVIDAVSVPLAPLAEQRRIVARIDELFTEIADGETALARARDDLDTWRRALLKAAVTGELTREWRETNKSRETGESALIRIRKERETKSVTRQRQDSSANSNDGRDVPPGWAWATLEALGSIESGQTPNGIAATATSKGEFPWFKVSSMNNAGPDGSISVSQWYVSANDAYSLGLRIHPPGTIVFPKRGGSILTNKKRRLAVAGAFDLNTMGYIPHRDYAEYCWLFLRNLDLKRLYDGSSVPQINYGDIAYVRIAVPPPDEGLEIAQKTNDLLSTVDEMTINLEQGQRDAIAARQSILKAAFEGRLVEQDSRDEPADCLLTRSIGQTQAAGPTHRRQRGRRAALAAK